MKLIDRIMYFLPAILLGVVWIIGFYYYFEFPDLFESCATFFYILNVPIVIWCVVSYGHKFKQE